MLTELLMADHPSPCAKQRQTGDCELEALAERFEVVKPRLPARVEPRGRDDSSLVIAVDHNACILCDRCVRGCNDIRDNQVIGRMGKGYTARIAFDLDDPMGDSSCVACGECMVSCPTGALTHRGGRRADPWKDVDPPPSRSPPASCSSTRSARSAAPSPASRTPFLRWNARAVVRRHFKKGEVICREGEFGSTAFFIEQGSVEIFIKAPRQARRSSKARLRASSACSSGSPAASSSRDEDDREEEGTRSYHPHRRPGRRSPTTSPVATLGAGDLFGEMTCMNFYPRSATVRAAEDCTVLEMLRNVLYILQRSTLVPRRPGARSTATAPSPATCGACRSSPPCAGRGRSSTGSSTGSATRSQLAPLRPRRGDLPPGRPGRRRLLPGAHRLREGLAERPRRRARPELRRPGRLLRRDRPAVATCPRSGRWPPPGVRTATCTALDHVDVVRITAEDFREILDQFPARSREPLVEEALKRLERERGRRCGGRRSIPLGDFLGQGLMNAQSLLVLDLEKCTRCDECTKACADAHDGVTRLIREGLRFDKFLVASSCRSCLDPYCMVGCPVGSIHRRELARDHHRGLVHRLRQVRRELPLRQHQHAPVPTGETAPDPDRPGRTMAVVQQKATTCDLCHDLGPAEPSCVYACPHDAAHRMSGSTLRDLVEQSTRF